MIDGLRSKYGDLSPLCLSVGLFRKSGCVLYRRPAVPSFVRVNDRVEKRNGNIIDLRRGKLW